MPIEEVEDKVKNIIAEQAGCKIEEVTDEAIMLDDLGMDSLDAVETTMYLEEEFGFEISDEDAESMNKVKDVVEYIQKRVKEK